MEILEQVGQHITLLTFGGARSQRYGRWSSVKPRHSSEVNESFETALDYIFE